MSDDRRESTGGLRDEGVGRADGGAAPGPDRTQPIDPQPEPDETRPLPPGATARDVPDRRTRAFDPRAGAGPSRPPGGAGAWSGRAGVPPPRPAAGATEPTGWGEYDTSGGRPWWTPILIGLAALLFLGILAFALWLVSESADRNGPPEPSPSATAAERSPTSRPSPTATTGRPTPSRTSAAPIAVPPLVGLRLSEAQDLLDELGLASRLEFRRSDRPAGTVIDTDPGAGALAAPGDTVTLVVAQPRPSPPGPPTPTASGPTSPGR